MVGEIHLIENKIQNKTIQKARESRRISEEVKDMLVKWRV
jgi:hypothetical protein